MSEKERISTNDILLNIKAAAAEKNVSLSYQVLRVYLSLLNYAEENKDITVSSYVGVRFQITTAGLAEYCSVTPSTITKALRRLSEAGVIKYTTNTPKPSVVMLYRKYFE